MQTFDEAARKRLLEAVKAGSDLETAAHYAGLSVPELYRELERGRVDSERGYETDAADLWADLKRVRAEAIVRNVASIQNAAAGGEWRAAAWWLERSVPEQYGAKPAERAPLPAAEPREIAGG